MPQQPTKPSLPPQQPLVIQTQHLAQVTELFLIFPEQLELPSQATELCLFLVLISQPLVDATLENSMELILPQIILHQLHFSETEIVHLLPMTPCQQIQDIFMLMLSLDISSLPILTGIEFCCSKLLQENKIFLELTPSLDNKISQPVPLPVEPQICLLLMVYFMMKTMMYSSSPIAETIELFSLMLPSLPPTEKIFQRLLDKLPLLYALPDLQLKQHSILLLECSMHQISLVSF
jgi:hypothetical protein